MLDVKGGLSERLRAVLEFFEGEQAVEEDFHEAEAALRLDYELVESMLLEESPDPVPEQGAERDRKLRALFGQVNDNYLCALSQLLEFLSHPEPGLAENIRDLLRQADNLLEQADSLNQDWDNEDLEGFRDPTDLC